MTKHAYPKWDTSCPDWEKRLVKRESIIPKPIFPDAADKALAIFKSLRVTDVPGKPTFGECSAQWVFDFVRAIYGAYDSKSGDQLIREFFLLISKKNTKSTIAAGIMLTAVILSWREHEEHLIIAPTKEVADNSFKPAASMVRADPELSAMFHVQDHIRTITHRVNKCSLKVVAADTETVSGKKSGRILVDELWIFGKRPNAEAMLMEATGGQVSRNEGWIIYLSTQSDEPPSGVFRQRLEYFRKVRDGDVVDPKSLPVIYEFPHRYIKNELYLRPENFYITNPNIGRSVSSDWIEGQLKRHIEDVSNPAGLQAFIAKHLNVEMGAGLRVGNWVGADYWAQCEDANVTLESLLGRSDVCVIGVDGGGLDDLLGLAVVGRDRETGAWLHYGHAWAHRIVLERRKEIASRLADFEAEGTLTVVDRPGDDIKALAGIVARVRQTGLLPTKGAIGVDPAGIGELVDALIADDVGCQIDQIAAVSQGWKMNAAIKTTERKLAAKQLLHGGTALMAWCVSNAKQEPHGNAVSITKAVAGAGKIDPLMALFDAVTMMAYNPVAEGATDADFDYYIRHPVSVNIGAA